MTSSSQALASIIRRIGWWILLFTVAGSAGLLLCGRFGWAGSFAAGGGVAYFGYWTQVQMVDRAMGEKRVRAVLLKVFLRYGLIILGVYSMMRLSKFEVTGFLAGLLLPAGAVLMESMGYLAKNFRGTGRHDS